MSEQYVLAIMDIDGVLPELFQWFELEAQAIAELKEKG